jgi:hypothetical protein
MFSGPGALDGAETGKLMQGLAQELGAGPAFADDLGLAALFAAGGDAGKDLEAAGIGPALLVGAKEGG